MEAEIVHFENTFPLFAEPDTPKPFAKFLQFAIWNLL